MKLTRNKAVLIVLFVIAPFCLHAQDVQPSRVHEMGFTFSRDYFGLRYKWGGDATLYRITVLSLNGSNSRMRADSIQGTGKSVGFGFDIGIEKRHPIINQLGVYYGFDLLARYSDENGKANSTYMVYSDKNNYVIKGGLGFVLGLNYTVSRYVLLSVELEPAIWVSRYMENINGQKYTTFSYMFGLNNSGAGLTLSYRF